MQQSDEQSHKVYTEKEEWPKDDQKEYTLSQKK
jgi:hypothetical protein